MKKFTFQNSEGTKLVGVLHTPQERTSSAVILSHGFASNKGRSYLVKLAEALCENSIAALRFDFGGCGESGQREARISKQVDDLKSAIDYARKAGYTSLGLFGVSLGCLITVLAYDEMIKVLVLWSPVIHAKTPSMFQKESFQKELDAKGFVIYQGEERALRVPKEYLEERLAVNQKEMLSKVKCPVLIVHGSKDATVPLEHSEEALQFLSRESNLEIVKDGDHKLSSKMDEIIPLSVDWLREYLIRK